MVEDFLILIRKKATQKILFLPHAVRQMSNVNRMISTYEIREVIFEGEIIEDYPEDARGHSCLMFKDNQNRAIHVVCTPKDEYLAIITAYIPDDRQWNKDYKIRIKK